MRIDDYDEYGPAGSVDEDGIDTGLLAVIEATAPDELIPAEDELAQVVSDLEQAEDIPAIRDESKPIGPVYGESLLNAGLEAIHQIATAQQAQYKRLAKPTAAVMERAKNKRITGTRALEQFLFDDPWYTRARLSARSHYLESLNGALNFVEPPNKSRYSIEPLDPSEIALISLDFDKLKMDSEYHERKSLVKINKIVTEVLEINNNRLISAAGLAMLDFYEGQNFDTGYCKVKLPDENDAITLATSIAGYQTTFSSQGRLDRLADHAIVTMREHVVNPNHSTLIKEDPFQARFIVYHIIARLLDSQVLAPNGHFYFQVGERYSPKTKTLSLK